MLAVSVLRKVTDSSEASPLTLPLLSYRSLDIPLQEPQIGPLLLLKLLYSLMHLASLTIYRYIK